MAIRALVVGGTSGVGYGMACRLAAELSSDTVIISGRTKPQNLPHANMEFIPLEATSMRNIKQYTDNFKSTKEPRLDYLVMTQGIMTMDGRTETPEGIDRKMALHYYGKQLLIRELLPVMQEDGKVVIVYDSIYGNPAKLDWDDLDLKTSFGLGSAANHCMVMNDAMVQYWATQQQQSGNEKRFFIHAWPGGVNTGLWRELPWYLRPTARVAGNLIGVSPDTCAVRLLKGINECVPKRQNEGKFWFYMDNKGNFVPKKAIWTEDQMRKIADHTWTLIDGGIQRTA